MCRADPPSEQYIVGFEGTIFSIAISKNTIHTAIVSYPIYCTSVAIHQAMHMILLYIVLNNILFGGSGEVMLSYYNTLNLNE